MDKIILGALMIRGMSVYDLKTLIQKNLSAMCSASAGSIYTALKKLLEKGYIGEEPLEDDCEIKRCIILYHFDCVEYYVCGTLSYYKIYLFLRNYACDTSPRPDIQCHQQSAR